jgi:hypothetical protein
MYARRIRRVVQLLSPRMLHCALCTGSGKDSCKLHLVFVFHSHWGALVLSTVLSRVFTWLHFMYLRLLTRNGDFAGCLILCARALPESACYVFLGCMHTLLPNCTHAAVPCSSRRPQTCHSIVVYGMYTCCDCLRLCLLRRWVVCAQRI